jgi:hypothetical protein
MLDDPVLDALMVFQAVATLLLALQVHSLSKHSSAQQLVRERTQKDTQKDNKPEPEEPKPKLSPQEEYLEWLNSGGTAAKPEEKPTTTLAAESPPSLLPHGKSEPFNPEGLTEDA